MAVTRAQVARRAGTSPALVSYVLNDGPRSVAPATRDRILAAIDELGYRPNAVARSLRMARGHSLGLIVPDSSNPFFAQLARAVEETAFEHGYPIFVGNAADQDVREIGYLRAFTDRQVEGLLVIPTSQSPALVREYAAVHTPLVVIDRLLDPERLPNVTTDGVAGAVDAVNHLLEHGHRRIACVSGPVLSTSEGRIAGYRLAMKTAGRRVGPMVRRRFDGTEGYEVLPELLRGRTSPTAVFVTSDLQALGLMRAAFDLGITIPDDLAVVSFDGIEYAAYTVPGLTTVAQPMRTMGKIATEILLAMMKDGLPSPGVRTLPTKLERRASCGCSEAG